MLKKLLLYYYDVSSTSVFYLSSKIVIYANDRSMFLLLVLYQLVEFIQLLSFSSIKF